MTFPPPSSAITQSAARTIPVSVGITRTFKEAPPVESDSADRFVSALKRGLLLMNPKCGG